MRRLLQPGGEEVGSDSFLDVVANIVGILIILVLVVGVRVKNAPVMSEDAEAEAPVEEGIDLAHYLASADRLQADVLKLANEIENVNRMAAVQFAQREAIATRVEQRKRELDARRQSLDEQQRRDLELEQQIASAREELRRVQQETVALEKREPRQVEIENLPTPLSKVVDGKEGHFQLRGGRIAVIPLDRLLERFRADAEGKLWKLRDSDSFTETVGPLGGFQLRYTLQRVEVTVPPRNGSPGGRSSFAELTEWKLIPVADGLGEPLEVALQQPSELSAALAAIDPQETTITLWTYPDSFETYRELKKELYRRGYTTAGRPLPEGILIGGSPDGTRSAAQ